MVSCAIAVVALGTAGVAQAGSLSFTGGVVTYAAAGSERNHVLVAVEEEPVRGVRAVDIGAPVTAGAGCASVGPNEGFCVTPDLPEDIVVTLDDQNDFANTSAVKPPHSPRGGEGNDASIPARTNSRYGTAGPGADMFSGEGATVDYSSRTNPLTVSVSDNAANNGETGRNDLVTSDVQGILGGDGADTITLNQEFDTFVSGGPGNDEPSTTGVNSTSSPVVPATTPCRRRPSTPRSAEATATTPSSAGTATGSLRRRWRRPAARRNQARLSRRRPRSRRAHRWDGA